MGGNGLSPIFRTAREKSGDLIAEGGLEGLVLNRSVFGIAQTTPFPCILIGQAGNLGLGERFLLNEDPLALIAASRPAEPHDHRCESARFPGSAGKRGITGGQEHQMVEVRTFETQRSVSLHEQQVAAAAAFSTDPLLQRRDDDEIGSPALILRQACLLGLGKIR
jgi:hypothetical protein